MTLVTDLSGIKQLINLSSMSIQLTQTNLDFGLILPFLICFKLTIKQLIHYMINSIKVMDYLQHRNNVLMTFQMTKQFYMIVMHTII